MQREAVEYTEGPLLLLAGAGSGKTRVLVNRVANLVQKGVRPFNILAITFTNKAACEMKERIETLLEGTGGVWVSTFHSLCVRILRREISKLGYDAKFTIYDADDSQRIMKQVYKEHNINEKLLPVKAALGAISRQKDILVTAEQFAREAEGDYQQRQIALLYDAYQRKLKANNALDFDDLICKTVELFDKSPETLERYQNRFIYISVDEYQDTNFGQYRLVWMLSRKNNNICVVGDDDQSIYGWRGADIRNILEFERDFPGAKVIKLEQNYRSTKTILAAANGVIQNNVKRKDKELWTENTEGSLITHYTAETDLEEAGYVVDEIVSRAAKAEKYKDFAILYRMNAQSRLFEDRLVRENVPYRVFGGVRFYDRMEVKDVLAYLKALYNPLDDISLRRIINVPRRGIGEESVARLEAYAAEMEVPFYDAVCSWDEITGLPYNGRRVKDFSELLKLLMEDAATRPVTEILDNILKETNYVNELLTAETDHDMAKERVANVMELTAKAAEFKRQAEEAGEEATLAAFLEEVALVADIDAYSEQQDAVALMTMHSAKGLEFDNVFVVGFEEHMFPTSRAIFSASPAQLEEERRLCYVALTRARKRLYVTSAVTRRFYNEQVYNSPSRFLKEIPKELMRAIKSGRPVSAGAERKATLSHVQDGYTKPRTPPVLPKPKTGPPDFSVGNYVNQKKYGRGKVLDIKPAGADYEVTVEFAAGVKKFMAHLSNLERVE
jgi:DNA helicase-2/ATP-dependent DNA helicase PcrA